MNRMNYQFPEDFPVEPDYIINYDRDLIKLLKNLHKGNMDYIY